MKTLAPVLFLIFVICLHACTNEKTLKPDKGTIAIPDPAPKSQNPVTANTTGAASSNFSISLVPIEILDSTSNDPFKKYGIEFSGNCYACDLARISLKNRGLKIINVCDDNDVQHFENVSVTNSKEQLSVSAGKIQLLFHHVNPAPVYELMDFDQKTTGKNKRLSRFYTDADSLKKFVSHDCGDFGG